MPSKRSQDRVIGTAPPLPPILVGARVRGADTLYDVWLTLFLRAVAIAWIGEGVLQWMAVLTDESGTLLAHASPLRMSALFFFCVLDFVAAVGLWLVTTWGVAVWIATILGHGLVATFGADFLPERTATLVSDVVLISVYAALALLAARDERRA